MGVVDPVDLQDVLEQHEDHVGEKAEIFAEAIALEEFKYLPRQFLEVLIVLQNIRNI